MTVKEILGAELYEQIRAVIKAAIPGPSNDIPDELVDAFVGELKRRGQPGIEALGLPDVAPREPEAKADAVSYPLYLGHADHARVLAMDSTKPFHSEFVGHLPLVRVPLPAALDSFNTTLHTQIGVVDFARDHLAGSVASISNLYAEKLGYTPARVDLITPARKDGFRFAAVAIYLGYRLAGDTAPSFYVLEAGLATGQAVMLYLGDTVTGTIVEPSGYIPTPFSAANNTYTGNLTMDGDQPVQLVIQANAPDLPYYIQVTIQYESVSSPPSILPITLLVEAIERVAAIGKTMGVSADMPKLVEDILGDIGLACLPWVQKPQAIKTTETSRAHSPLAQRLIAVGQELVNGFRHIGEGKGTSAISGRPVQITASLHEELSLALRDIAEGTEKDPARRLAPLLGRSDVKATLPDFSALPNGATVVAAMNAVALGSGSDGSITGTGTRQTWANQLANQKVQPLVIYQPTSLNAEGDSSSLTAILQSALATGSKVKAAGSGHSYSDVATTPDLFIDTHALNAPSSPEKPITGQLDRSVVRAALPLALGPIDWPSYDPEKHHALIEVEAGISIRDLNTLLESRNLGLINMGGYDAQTIVGAISTSTHGSGIGIGPFPDMVRSLVLATTGRWGGKTVGGSDPGTGVYYYRIEPTDGITDPAKYQDPLIQLIQDDDCFDAVICSMGCFGVIYSVVLEVMQMYWLEETRCITSLDKVMQDLTPNPANEGNLPDVLAKTRNYEVLIQPYPLDWFKVVDMDPNAPPEEYYKYFMCLVTKRNIAPQPSGPVNNRPPLPDWLGRLLAVALDEVPDLTPEAVDVSLLTLVEDPNLPFGKAYVNKSYEIYNLGLGGGVGFAAEIGFSLDDGYGKYTNEKFKAAIDSIHLTAQRARQQGNQYQTSAFSLRFVHQSRAQLSMMQGRNTAMIEMDMLTGTYAGEEIMYRYETSMYPLGGRPHWGLEFNFMTGNNGLLGKMYPKLGRWLTAYRQFNALGTFDNSFTQRMGFTVLE